MHRSATLCNTGIMSAALQSIELSINDCGGVAALDRFLSIRRPRCLCVRPDWGPRSIMMSLRAGYRQCVRQATGSHGCFERVSTGNGSERAVHRQGEGLHSPRRTHCRTRVWVRRTRGTTTSSAAPIFRSISSMAGAFGSFSVPSADASIERGVPPWLAEESIAATRSYRPSVWSSTCASKDASLTDMPL
jgi:hypothetical protein